MKQKLRRILLFAIAAWLLVSVAQAQQNGQAPFADGETLTYEGKFTKIFTASVADLTFTIDRRENDYLVKAEARSKSTLLKMFRFTFLQQLESTIDAERFRAVKTVKHDVQKERVRDSEALFDYREKRVTYTEVDPKEPNKAPRRIASEIDGTTHDLISGVYSLRLLPLEVGKTFELTVSDSGLVYEIPVRVTGRERLKTVLGRVWCFRVEPDVFGPGRLIEKEGKMVIWMTDDAVKLPVRSIVNAWIGKIDIRLRSAKNVKNAPSQTAQN